MHYPIPLLTHGTRSHPPAFDSSRRASSSTFAVDDYPAFLAWHMRPAFPEYSTEDRELPTSSGEQTKKISHVSALFAEGEGVNTPTDKSWPAWHAIIHSRLNPRARQKFARKSTGTLGPSAGRMLGRALTEPAHTLPWALEKDFPHRPPKNAFQQPRWRVL